MDGLGSPFSQFYREKKRNRIFYTGPEIPGRKDPERAMYREEAGSETGLMCRKSHAYRRPLKTQESRVIYPGSCYLPVSPWFTFPGQWEGSTMGDRAEGYPYLVVRLMPAVYVRYPIDFLQNSGSKLSSEALLSPEPEPFDKDGKLTTDCKKKLIEVVRFEARESGLRMCVVFAPKEALYVEPSGRCYAALLPSGGMDLGRPPYDKLSCLG